MGGKGNMKTKVRAVLVALGLIGGIAGAATLTTPAEAAGSWRPVPIRISGNVCYPGGSFAFWRAATDGSTTGNMYSTSDNIWETPGRHVFNAQVWCRSGPIIGAGRSGAQAAWVYTSGYQPTITIYSGLFIGV
jgi:hypothetical protein